FFIFWSPQPRLRATIQGYFFLASPMPLLAYDKILAWEDTGPAVTLRELATGKMLASFRGPPECAPPMVFSHSGRTVAAASKDEMAVKVWDLATGNELATLRGHTGAVQSLAFSPDGKTLASGGRDKTVKLWAVSSGQNTATLQGHTACVSAVA